MIRRVAITGIGVISALGDSPVAMHDALYRGMSGLRAVEDGAFEHRIDHRVGYIRSFKPEFYLPDRNLRPLDRTGQLAISAARLALQDSGWTAEKLKEREVGLVLGTMFGSAHTISKFDRQALLHGPSTASPMDFANTVISAAAGQTAIWHKLRGFNSTIACGTTSGLAALGYAADLIRAGRQTTILAGGADEFCFESFRGFEQAGLLYKAASEADGPLPFDARRAGFAPGEGAAFLMLEEWESAVTRGASILAEIRGYANAYDPAPSEDARKGTDAIARAIRLACADARVALNDVDCISASANGSIETDRNEGMAIQALWPESHAPVTAIKSMLGETLGASAVFQAIGLLETLRTGTLPGIPELEQLAPELSALNVSRQPRPFRVRHGLVSSAGLDGHASALVLSEPA